MRSEQIAWFLFTCLLVVTTMHLTGTRNIILPGYFCCTILLHTSIIYIYIYIYIQDKVKGKFYRIVIIPAMLYGSEYWALKRQHEHKIEVAEMRMLRWMYGENSNIRVRNQSIMGA